MHSNRPGEIAQNCSPFLNMPCLLSEDGDLVFRLRGGSVKFFLHCFAESDPGTPEIAAYKVDE